MSGSTVSQGVRWPTPLHGRIKVRASAARMDFSTYVVAIMQSRLPELSPALAALGEMTAVLERMEAGDTSADQIESLRGLVLQLCHAAAMEAKQ